MAKRVPLLDLRLKRYIFMAHDASTNSGKAQQLNAARVLLSVKLRLPEAVRRLSHQFDLSEAPSNRYWKKPPSSIDLSRFPEATVPITLKLPPRTVELLGSTREAAD